VRVARRIRTPRLRVPECLGYTALAVYVAWNVWWLGQGAIPPSILRHVTGVPAPTTGMTRSVLALVHGDVGRSLLWNPCAVPVAVLYLVTGGVLVLRFVRRETLRLHPALASTWIGVLLLAWLAKLALGPTWW